MRYPFPVIIGISGNSSLNLKQKPVFLARCFKHKNNDEYLLAFPVYTDSLFLQYQVRTSLIYFFFEKSQIFFLNQKNAKKMSFQITNSH